MKNFITIFLLTLALFSSCDLIDPLKEKLDGVPNNVTQTFTYTLTDADFATITKRALYLNPADTQNVAFLKKYKFFTDQVQAGTYVPMLLDQNFPMYQSGSQAKISYLYKGNQPDELSVYASAPAYTLISADYKRAGTDVEAAGFFSPVYNPDNFLPAILKTRIDTAASGSIYAITYNYSAVEPKIDYSAYMVNPVWENGLTTSTGYADFQVISQAGNQNWKWVSSDNGALYIDGWDNGYNDNEDWLITPEIDLKNSSNTYLQLRQAVEYFDTGCLFVLVSTNYDGQNISSANWKEVSFPGYSGSNKNNYIETNAVDLSAFDGKKVRVAFKYISNATKAPYWGISQVKIGPYGYKVTGGDSYKITDYYQYDGTKWNKLNGVYQLNARDYEKMGLTAFSLSGSEATLNYLPLFAAQNFPYASEGQTMVFVYQYNTGSETITLADKLTFTAGEWTNSFNYIRTITEPYASTVSGWVFDPTVNLTMTKADYLLIATYVKNDPVLSELDPNTYVDSDYYFGASGYYGNFDTRNGKFYSGFGKWENAVAVAIGSVLLPAKYPDAETQYKGIDMHYLVHFVAYGAPATNYYMKFQCTKSGPDPEFTLVEGPVAE